MDDDAMMKDGGPAFPQAVVVTPLSTGMSLRDWFAGQALTGLVAAMETRGANRDVLAWESYAVADAMLKERVREE